MTVYVALLHSIVLAPGRRVVMSELRAMAEGLGFRDARTLVSTGNLVFEAQSEPVGVIEAQLEEGFRARYGKHVDIIVRDAPGWLALAAGNPFPPVNDAEAKNIVVRVMRSPLSSDMPANIERGGGEQVAVVNGDLWIRFPGPPSESKLLSALTTKRLGPGTFRNWNTVRGLTDMIEA
ncbi:DUF1697 domain-containing protein [Pararhizobium qamdonense]|uniref:DUF1697 domain-containing protein n=1 Tax=Pararhizobium qamdonense TaxID=3031126 RepID=UPI0023E20A0C|nr:DUF1697 domain-containing protein [Pararhizobium qamdonense]